MKRPIFFTRIGFLTVIFVTIILLQYNGMPFFINRDTLVNNRNPSRVTGPSTVNVYGLSPEEIEKLKVSADLGNKNSIGKLFDYYAMVEYNLPLQNYWFEKLADTGDLDARKSIVEYYATRKTEAGYRKARELRSRYNLK